MSESIPKLIHQTFPTKDLPLELAGNVDKLKADNPDWAYRLYDDSDIEEFIFGEYGNGMLDRFLSISPTYGAARADLFRYLLMHKHGGVYVDIKSSFVRPLSQALTLREGFILSKWRNGPGEPFPNSGLHPELAAFPRGEYQQWHIICAPGHPFLAAVIDRVLDNISRYGPWHGVGRIGVLRLTGPIAYTLAIEPIKALHKHKELHSHDEIGLCYSTLGTFDHRVFFRNHYTRVDTPIITPKGIGRISATAYIAARRLKRSIFNRNEEP